MIHKYWFSFLLPHRMRQNQMILEQEGQRNAPDPRESNPPCYDDAILMPRLKASFTSLKLSSFAASDADILMRRAGKRTRSEEILGAASLDRNQRPIAVARSRKRLDNWTYESGESSTALIKNGSTADNDPNQSSFEVIAQFETEDGHSPYAKRKPIPTIACQNQIDSSFESLHKPETTDDDGDGEYALYQNQNIPHTSQIYSNTAHPPLSKPPSPLPSSVSSFTSSSSSCDSNNYIILPQRRSTESHYANVYNPWSIEPRM